MSKKIVLSTGGTGGHIFPMIALYDYLISKNYDVSFVTDKRGEKYFTDDTKYKIKIFNINSPFNQKQTQNNYWFRRVCLISNTNGRLYFKNQYTYLRNKYNFR